MLRPERFLALAMAVASLLVVGGQGARAAGPSTAGPFTAAQVSAGRAAYGASCAGCHGAALSGMGDAPALTGATFVSSWGKKSTRDFYRFMSASMPYGAAGSLSEATNTEIAAFILAVNGAKPGDKPYTKDTDVPVSQIADGHTVASVASLPAAKAAQSPPRAANQFPLGQTVEGTVKDYVDVTEDMLRNPSNNDWLMFRRNYAGWSYSPLAQVTPQNVKSLQLVWSWAMNVGGAVEVTPIVNNGVMFLSNSSNTVQALNAETGELIWENRLGPISTAAYGATRSIAVYKDKVYVATYDAKLYALDARTGHKVWTTVIGSPPKGETGGVMVARGKVLTGLMGCSTFSEEGCYISAYDADTGKLVWKFRTNAAQGTPGGDTWGDLPNHLRGGADTWIAGTYDPDLNLTYWGVAQAKPWMRASRGIGGAAALYTSSTLALDADTGQLKWYFQHAPGESLDLDEVFERVLIDHGSQKTVMTIGKPGILWKLDRETGKFISLKETVFQNVFAKVDQKTGQLTYRDDLLNQKTGEYYASCPGPQGGHDWQATSYYPPGDLLIIPLSQSCVMMKGLDAEMKVGGGGAAASQLFYFMPGADQNMGRLTAINTTTMKTEWTWQQRSPFLTAVLSTGGGVAFVGDFDRHFKAIEAKTGKVLWETRLGQTVQGYPVSFSVHGRQYIAVTTGTGGGSPQQKPSTMLTEVHRPTTGNGHQLYVFALPTAE